MNVGLLISGISWVLGAVTLLIFSRRCLNNPGSPNRISGYRTARSMASQENWETLNAVAMGRFKFASYILLVLGCLLIWAAFIVSSTLLVTVLLGMSPLAVIIAPAVLTFIQEKEILERHRNSDNL
jgi:hypothetical protein